MSAGVLKPRDLQPFSLSQTEPWPGSTPSPFYFCAARVGNAGPDPARTDPIGIEPLFQSRILGVACE